MGNLLVEKKNLQNSTEDETEKPTSRLHRSRTGRFLKFMKIHVHVHQDKKSELREQGQYEETFRLRLGRFLESHRFQAFIIFLIVLDLAILFAELLLTQEESKNEENPTTEDWIHIFEKILYWTTFGILCTFALEIVGLLVAFGKSFFRHPMYVIDGIVIAVAICLELIFKSYLTSALILLRLWRLLRIVHAVILAEEDKNHNLKEKYEGEINELKKQINELQTSNSANEIV